MASQQLGFATTVPELRARIPYHRRMKNMSQPRRAPGLRSQTVPTIRNRNRIPVEAALADLGWPPVDRAFIEQALSTAPTQTLRVVDSGNDAAFARLRRARSGPRGP